LVTHIFSFLKGRVYQAAEKFSCLLVLKQTMAGGLMQLVAYGAQDVYLTGSPKVTFFQAVYKRHTNFAMENIEQVVNGTAANSARLSVTVARNGDLIGEMYLELTSNAFANVSTNAVTDVSGTDASNEWVAERAVADIELTIGGQRIDKHYQKWWRLYSELYLDEAKKAQYGKMASATALGNKVFLPMIFFFNRNPGLYLPLIALQYHEVRLDITLSATYNHYFGSNSVKVWGNYVYLDTEERRRFAQKGHEYLIEQVQHTGVDTVNTTATAKQVRLSYNHPVKELVWCFSEHGTSATGNDMWNTAYAGGANVTTLFGAAAGTTNVFSSSLSLCGCPQMVVGVNATGNKEWLGEDGTGAGLGVGPLDTFKLILNGQDRFKEQSGKYFNQVQPFYHHSGNPYLGIYSYSFALKPEEHQPTGTCNFSRIDNAQVEVKSKNGSRCANMHMFAVNYNVLRIQSGMGGLAFSN
jgi:hypothetical protein